MSIQSFTLKNYRSFVDRTTIELRPLTLLFGYNSSGKSALLRALPLIIDSLKGRSRTPLDLNCPAIRGSNFSDLLSTISGTQELDIELSIFAHDLKWTIRNLPELKTHVVSRYSIDNWFVAELKQKDIYLIKANDNFQFKQGMKFINSQEGQDFYKKQGISIEKLLDAGHAILKNGSDGILHFHGLLGDGSDTSYEDDDYDRKTMAFKGIFYSIVGTKDDIYSELILNNTNFLQWLTSIRKPPLRNNPFKGAAPEYMQPDGNGAADILAYDSISDESLILPKVSSWYEKNLQQKIVIEEMAEYFQIKLQKLNSPSKVNIVDVGEGLIQVLPVLVAGAMASKGYTNVLAIEEPESHLHPKLHAALAEYFFEIAKQEEPPKVLLETHSENFLLRTQLEIAQGELDPELVMVYWVRQLEDGRSVAEPVTFDEKGRPQGEWPRDIFYTDVELSRQLVQERRKHS
ncbi:AAA family ATPase [Candidatus Halobeggiatoa sp. HSG11]|nr:AAA family ATPase [Candidatus Halobeggiatoa sp. HSG11]